jgi:hypothetical protein
MKSVKALCLIVGLALIVTALAGAASASATVLCKENTATCSTGSIYPKEIAIEATGLSFKIKNSIATINCSSSSMAGKTTGEKGAPLSAEITSLTVSKCTNCPGVSEARNLPFKAGLERSEAGDGTLALENGGKGAPSMKFSNCWGLGISCIYGVSPLNLHFEGGSPAKLTAQSVTLVKQEGSSSLCPTTGTLEATYEITSPKPAYARAGAGVGETVFCKEGGTVCQKAATYPGGTTIEAKSTFVLIQGTGLNTGCEGSTMSLESSAESGNPLHVSIPSMTFSSCRGGCKTVEAQNLPLTGVPVEATSGGNGTLRASFQWKLTGCSSPNELTCIYGANNAKFTITGGTAENAKLEGAFTMNKEEGSSLSCHSSIEVAATYYVTSPTALWVGKVEA